LLRHLDAVSDALDGHTMVESSSQGSNREEEEEVAAAEKRNDW
jgi:hypothetical protein